MNVAIVGAGKLGIKVAEALIDGDYSITIIDKNEAVIEKVSQQLDVMTITDDARKISVLKDAGIGSFDYLLSSTDSDETNIVIAAFAKKLGCSRVIARIRDPEHMNQFEFIKKTMNIDYITNPDMAISVEIYKYLSDKYASDQDFLTTDKIAITEFPAVKMKNLIGMPIPKVRETIPNVLVAALSRNGKVLLPHGSDVIEKDDYVYLIGEKSTIKDIHAKTKNRTRQGSHKKVMIIGGGKTGYYLAQSLEEMGMSVKIVEISIDRCRYLSANLDNVMILHGTGTDIALLEEENIDNMDAFITATGYDEENLLVALTAKNHHVPDVICKVSHENYQDLISQMGLDMVLNPLDISTSSVIRYIQGSTKIVSSVLIQGQAEILEMIAKPGMKMTQLPLSRLDIPDDVLVAAINRHEKLIIPDGNTTIQDGDKVIILSLLTDIGDIEKLMRGAK
ncbi:MAG: Trk system potassium transporter TrkA [Eubacteriales bacterium]|nr:Trk system potassium transporter TrkA [Eubacteriales bacterium]